MISNNRLTAFQIFNLVRSATLCEELVHLSLGKYQRLLGVIKNRNNMYYTFVIFCIICDYLLPQVYASICGQSS